MVTDDLPQALILKFPESLFTEMLKESRYAITIPGLKSIIKVKKLVGETEKAQGADS